MQIKQQTQSIIIMMSLTLTTAASANTVEQAFTTEQMQQLSSLLKQQNLLDQNNQLVDVISRYGDNQPVGLFSPLYQYVYTIIKDSNTVDQNTKFWFSQAAAINAANTSVPASNYIRGATQYGLQYRGAIQSNMPQSQINQQLQKTSNLIGQNIINDILNAKGIPVFPAMISNDISAAIGNYRLGRFQQTPGGWGGSFYYWNAPLNYGQVGQNNVSVGQSILYGATVYINGSNQSFDRSKAEFLYANSQAVTDFILASKSSTVILQSLQNPTAINTLVENAINSIMTGLNAQAPQSIKAQLAAQVITNLTIRAATYNWTPGPHSPTSGHY
ncbi:hypothetical protein F889_01704 [Acinetobacter colistiniresistens]|uniref:Uncharacterized protein n=1 Tax=Acinetobacter colistiniresistens TaxID=280145 RepID=N9R5J7_9GAMM|nr:hypothetical protein [Acinetobacter colistiniresistens]ENX34422.1 hypothetical protein F889_01704 [Acinetobacter colistiniresistens]